MISLRVGLLSLALVLAAACEKERTPLGPPPPCKSGEMCGTVAAAGMGVGSGGAGGQGGDGQGGEAKFGDLAGTIATLNSNTFDTTEPFDQPASVLALLEDGTETAAYDGTDPFLFEDLPTGDVWLLATPSQAATTLPVFTVHSVPSSNVVAPILAIDVLNEIAIGLPGQPFPQLAAAQIILKLERSGLPLPGVSVVGDTGDAVVAYDEGIGAYSSDVLATGTAGVLLLLNTFGPGDAAFTTLTVQDEALTEYTIEIPIQAGAATFATFELL
jgi:hypothetical protein